MSEAKFVYQDGTFFGRATWKKLDGTLIDPTTQSVTLIPPTGSSIAVTPAKESDGIYLFAYDTASDAPKGLWTVRWKATYESLDEVLQAEIRVV